jgi:hypothetical protein
LTLNFFETLQKLVLLGPFIYTVRVFIRMPMHGKQFSIFSVRGSMQQRDLEFWQNMREKVLEKWNTCTYHTKPQNYKAISITL